MRSHVSLLLKVIPLSELLFYFSIRIFSYLFHAFWYIGVAAAYEKMKRLLLKDTFLRQKIRDRVVARVQRYREKFTNKIFTWLVDSGIANTKEHRSKVEQVLFGPGSHKGWQFMNFFTNPICDHFEAPKLIF